MNVGSLHIHDHFFEGSLWREETGLEQVHDRYRATLYRVHQHQDVQGVREGLKETFHRPSSDAHYCGGSRRRCILLILVALADIRYIDRG